MKFNHLAPILWTDQLKETVSFYENILGFVVISQNPELNWVSLQKDDVEIMLTLPNEHIPFEKLSFTGSFYIRTDDVDEIWQAVKDKARVVYEIENFEWQMREFAIYDNNGYIIQFGQDISESK